MKLKNRTRAFFTMLTLSLSMTGCTHYRKNALAELHQIMTESTFSQNEDLHNYKKFYDTYLNTFIDYMSEGQYEKFKEMVYAITDVDEYDFDTILTHLDNINNRYHCGFYHALNNYLLFEELFPAYDLRDETFDHVHTIKSLINDDDAFFRAMFSDDISEMIDLIYEKTGIDDRKYVEELFIDFNYYVVAKNNHHEQSQNSCSARIHSLMCMIVQSKIEHDVEFASTFYGKMLKESGYYGKNHLAITSPLISGDAMIFFDSVEKGSYLFEFDSKYFYSESVSLKDVQLSSLDIEIQEALDNQSNSSEKFESSSAKVMHLLSFLLSPNSNLLDKNTPEEIREGLYQYLFSYFEGKDDFYNFLLGLFRYSSSAQERYFDILRGRIAEDGVELLDFERFQALVNFNDENTYRYYSSWDGQLFMSRDILTKKVSDVGDYVLALEDNYLFPEIDYHTEFANIEEMLKNNDLGFEFALNDKIECIWLGGPITYQNKSFTTVYSSTVDTKTMLYEGNSVSYFEVPTGFANGCLVEIFKNITGDTVAQPLDEVSTTIIDSETGEDKNIVILSPVNNGEEIPTEIRFSSPIDLFEKNYHAEKKLIKEIR